MKNYLFIPLLLLALSGCQLVSLPTLSEKPTKTKPKPNHHKPAEKPKEESKEEPKTDRSRKTERGMASYYGDQLHGNKTASGERYDKNKKTAAHPNLPFGTKIEVKNLKNGKKTVVTINDRGPYKKGRIVDISGAAARELGMIQAGIAEVEIVILD